MKYTTCAAVLIRSHLRAHPPMPLDVHQVLQRVAEAGCVTERVTHRGHLPGIVEAERAEVTERVLDLLDIAGGAGV
jgi:hypothetical protein